MKKIIFSIFLILVHINSLHAAHNILFKEIKDLTNTSSYKESTGISDENDVYCRKKNILFIENKYTGNNEGIIIKNSIEIGNCSNDRFFYIQTSIFSKPIISGSVSLYRYLDNSCLINRHIRCEKLLDKVCDKEYKAIQNQNSPNTPVGISYLLQCCLLQISSIYSINIIDDHIKKHESGSVPVIATADNSISQLYWLSRAQSFLTIYEIYTQTFSAISHEHQHLSYIKKVYSDIYSLTELDKHRIRLIVHFLKSEIDLEYVKTHFDTITLTTDDNKTLILNTKEFMEKHAIKHQKLINQFKIDTFQKNSLLALQLYKKQDPRKF